MDCPTFRANHLGFLDDTLQEQARVAMQRHQVECEACTQHDIAVRRGLMILHSLPAVTPSADFSSRLAARLREERMAMAREADASRRIDPLIRVSRVGPLAAVAVGLLLAGTLAVGSAPWWLLPAARSVASSELSLAPVVATRPESEPSPMAHPIFVAAASTGVPLWPAALLAEQVPMHFVTAEMRTLR